MTKPEPVLTDEQRLYLRCSATGGVHAFRLQGNDQWHVAHSLQKLGLGSVVDMHFTARSAGVAAVADELTQAAARHRHSRPQPLQLAEDDLPY